MRKIRFLRLGRYTLGGVIAELPALALNAHNAPFDAEDLLLVELGAIDAVGAGFFDFLSKQHSVASFYLYERIIHEQQRNCYCYFSGF